ncbi:ABC transporter ATP-binding protein [Streptococcus sp. NLN76]|uniref:ATP-binding cassette domain-containing protein n=1 Tax=Streptococcus sp. NLN76 TaxID=2822800 RepID=UPI0018AB8383|nr:ABC transporter ATP-binding protein [Streptococcus sp. NLN76]MBF8971110.1 ABC transporter ATP-binding protein [Streptococcus sp. NLN76]
MKDVFKSLKGDLITFSLLTIILSILMVGEAYLAQFIIDRAEISGMNYLVLTFIILMFLFSQTAVYFFQQFKTAVLSKRSAFLFRKFLFKKIQEIHLNHLNNDLKDRLLSALTVQIDQVEFNYFYTLYWGGYLLCQLVVAVVFAFTMDPLMAAMTLLLSLPNLLVALAYKGQLAQSQDDLIDQTDATINSIKDLTDGYLDWKVGDGAGEVYNVFTQVTQRLLMKQTKVSKVQYSVASLNQLFSNVLYFGSWLIGGYLILNNNLTLGSLITFTQLLTRISFPIYSSSDLIARFIGGKKIVDSLKRDFIFSKEDESLFENQPLLEFVSDIQFDKVASPLLSADSLTLSFQANQFYLIKGKSGSGKSTLFRLILKETNDYTGKITINGIDLSQLSEKEIFKKVAYVPQFPHIFSGTLKDNLTLFSDSYNHEQLYAVLEFVELEKWANDQSLSMPIKNEEVTISGGEAKRVALARALLLDKEILLIDEFSSGVDRITLEKIEKKLAQLNKLILYISHVSQSNVKQNFDYLIDLDNNGELLVLKQ